MDKYKRISDWIEIEYVEDEHDEEMDFKPSFWLAAAGWNRRFYLENFIRTHNNPWVGGEWPDYIHGYESDTYYSPLFIEISDSGDAVRAYEYANK